MISIDTGYVLQDAINCLEELRDILDKAAQGDEKSCDRFIGKTADLLACSEPLESPQLKYLLEVISRFSQYAMGVEYVRKMAADMAYALLLAESSMENYSAIDDTLKHQTENLAARLRAAIGDKAPPEHSHLFHCDTSSLSAQLCSELLVNIEKANKLLSASQVDQFHVESILSQTCGVLEVLGLSSARSACESAKGMLAQPGGTSPEMLSSVSIALSDAKFRIKKAIDTGIFVDETHPVADIEEKSVARVVDVGSVRTLSMAMPEQEILAVQPSSANLALNHDFFPSVAGTKSDPADDSGSGKEPDDEMRSIFIEEATAVLESLRTQLHEEKSVDAVRRAFHTLNGSSRMAELGDGGRMGDVAEAIEQMLTRMLKGDFSFNIASLDFISKAEKAFSGWIDALSKNEMKIDGDTWISRANAIYRSPDKNHPPSATSLNRILDVVPSSDVEESFIPLTPDLSFNLSAQNTIPDAVAEKNALEASIDEAKALSVIEEEVASSAIEAGAPSEIEDEIAALIARLEADQAQELTGSEDLIKLSDPRESVVAIASSPAPVAIEALSVEDDVDPQLLSIFIDESEELCPRIEDEFNALQSLSRTPHSIQDENVPIQSLNRLLHTLKGSSRMVGLMRIGEIAHKMEGRILQVGNRLIQPSELQELVSDFSLIVGLVDELRGGVTADLSPEASAITSAPSNSDTTLRVNAETIDHLVNGASEISTIRSGMEVEIKVFHGWLHELTGNISRLKQQLREIEIQAENQMQFKVGSLGNERFDPLEMDRFTRMQELTRFMSESVHDVQTVQQSMLRSFDNLTASISSQSRINKELQQSLMDIRMISFDSVANRFYRIVRQTCREMNKFAKLDISNGAIEIDRGILDKMITPFEHLLRNSIVHGLENQSDRISAGKPAEGVISINVQQENNEVVFTLSDDGAGLNFAKLREKASALGVDVKLAEDADLARLIFMPGLSTASEITEIAGRGVGMDIVRNEISSLGGNIDVSSIAGAGTTFVVRLPLTLVVKRTVMVMAGDQTYAIPLSMVGQVRRIPAVDMSPLIEAGKVEWNEKNYPLHSLSELCGDFDTKPSSGSRSVLLLRSGEQRCALQVDALIGTRDSIVKNIGTQLSRVSGIAGATVNGDGTTIMILDPVQMAHRGLASLPRKSKAAVQSVMPVVMVVDDSLTVRKVTSRLLARAGYQVVLAKDGADALDQIAASRPDIMLVDVEMPRMDGFELTKHIRRDPATRDIKIIMITSRTAAKHRDYALEIGVDEYMGKPYQEDALLLNISSMLSSV